MISTPEISFKKRLHQHCIRIIEDRIAIAVSAMNNAQDAANSEEKSSAGDKYETGRAMGHLEKEMHGKQLAANRSELAALLKIGYSAGHDRVTSGSFIKCGACSFYIAAGLGKILFENELIFVLSPMAPVAAALRNKKKGDSITFNNSLLTILEIY